MFEHEIVAVVPSPGIEQADDVRVGEVSQRADFVAGPVSGRRVGSRGDLEGDRSVEPRVGGDVDLRHRAPADQPVNPVTMVDVGVGIHLIGVPGLSRWHACVLAWSGQPESVGRPRSGSSGTGRWCWRSREARILSP